MVLTASQKSPRERTGSAIADERGIMLVEVLVSAVLLIVIALATLALIDRSGEASAMNRARSVSSALAQRDQDRIRQWPFKKFEDYVTPNQGSSAVITQPDVNIDGRLYKLTSFLKVVKADSSEQTACLAGWKDLRLLVETRVEPPKGHKMADIVMRTYRSPSLVSEADKGSVIVRLLRAAGTGAQNMTVTVNQLNADGSVGTQVASEPTQEDGCAVIDNLPAPAKYRVSWTGGPSSKWIDENGAGTVSRYLSLVAGETSQMSGRFDEGATLTARFVDDQGTPVSTEWNVLSTVHSGITTVYNGVRKWPKNSDDWVPATSIAAQYLFPFSSPYTVYAGDCWGHSPDIWGGSTPAWALATATPGGSITRDVVLPRVTVRIGAGNSGYKVYAMPDWNVPEMGTPRCQGANGIRPDSAPQSMRAVSPSKVAVTDSGGVATFPLPYGVWRICASNGTKRVTSTYNSNQAPRNTPVGSPAPYTPNRDVTLGTPANGPACPDTGQF